VKVEPEDEEVVRKTLKMINDKILEFKTEFAGRICRIIFQWWCFGMLHQRQTAQDAAGSKSLNDSLIN
jgi:hypothetical protein